MANEYGVKEVNVCLSYKVYLFFILFCKSSNQFIICNYRSGWDIGYVYNISLRLIDGDQGQGQIEANQQG